MGHEETCHVSLAAQDNGIGDKGMKKLAVALLRHRGRSPAGMKAASPIEGLHADPDGDDGATTAAEGSSLFNGGSGGNGGSLCSLRLDGNGLSAEACRALRAALRDGPSSLLELSLGGNPLGPAGLATLRLALGSVSYLRLPKVAAGPAGAAEVARALRSPPRCRLASLDLSGNPLSAEGARSLGEALPKCPTLRELQLEATGLEATGARELVERAAAGGGCTVETLGLRGNGLGPAGAEALAASLSAAFGSLTSLNLYVRNPVSASGDF